ncbi:MAG: tRNA 2-thiouridine(34) synthase MnmA [Dehalococcoidia bacterium]|nr:tRNA 2-thiouridine(34) synthase MnmA [Dehalococcoidia bacterium]
MNEKKRVVVAMSGGVDSSVAAALLLERGYEVVGVTMRLWSDGSSLRAGCCVLGADDAREVCRVLRIPHYVVNLEREFEEEVVRYFCREYEQGRTPNPCLACNDSIKFKHLLRRIGRWGAGYLATGHYARIRQVDGEYRLLRAVDDSKDQSYVLYTLGQDEMSRLLLPVGERTKAEVRRMAASLGLPVAEKRDSVEICFIPENDHLAFLKARSVARAPGRVVDVHGRTVGTHNGIAGYTIGQRRGLGVALGERRYVASIDARENVITIGDEEDLLSEALIADAVNWVSGRPPEGEAAVEAKIRYRTPAAPATVRMRGARAEVRFRERQRAVTPGQAVVFYQGEEVIGGGIISVVGAAARRGRPEAIVISGR